jgi:hypothetical protein
MSRVPLALPYSGRLSFKCALGQYNKLQYTLFAATNQPTSSAAEARGQHTTVCVGQQSLQLQPSSMWCSCPSGACATTVHTETLAKKPASNTTNWHQCTSSQLPCLALLAANQIQNIFGLGC